MMKIKLIFLLNWLTGIEVCRGQILITASQVQQMTFDYVIVGGGSGGATVAARLSEEPNLRVLILEAGGYPIPLASVPTFFLFQAGGPNTWHYPLEQGSTCNRSFVDTIGSYTQGKALGGCSTINGMLYVRPSPANYDSWAALGLTEWSYDNMLPYLIKMEDNVVPGQMDNGQVHGVDGPMTVSALGYVTPSFENFVQGAELNGFHNVSDYNAGNNLNDVSQLVFNIRNGSRCSTYQGYLNTGPTKTNLFISTNSYVTKVVFDGLRARGVEWAQDGHLYRANATKEVILSAGTIGSPKILLQSGIGPKDQLDQFHIPVVLDLPGVGLNLQDHVASNALVWSLKCTDCTYPVSSTVPLAAISQYVATSDGGLATMGGIEGTAFFNSRNESSGPADLQLFFVSNLFPTTDPDITSYYSSVASANNVMTIVTAALQTLSRGYVRLNSSDPLDYPLLNYNCLSDPQDVSALVQGLKVGKLIGDSSAFEALGAEFIQDHYPGCEGLKLFSDDYWTCVVEGSKYLLLHNVGTCKMGSDPLAVVDQQLRVRGVEGLRVVDASVMPLIVSANTNPATIAIGEKAADLIKSSMA